MAETLRPDDRKIDRAPKLLIRSAYKHELYDPESSLVKLVNNIGTGGLVGRAAGLTRSEFKLNREPVQFALKPKR